MYTKSCTEGKSACIFTYGQTGSGKTYSLFGSEKNIEDIRKSTNKGLLFLSL
jgi:hypothetical protein